MPRGSPCTLTEARHLGEAWLLITNDLISSIYHNNTNFGTTVLCHYTSRNHRHNENPVQYADKPGKGGIGAASWSPLTLKQQIGVLSEDI